MENILRVEKIEKYYGNKNNATKAIDNISTGKIMINNNDITRSKSKLLDEYVKF